MRCLERNKREFWYSLLDHTVDDGDEQYNVYAEPVKAMANISAATGESQAEMFGDAQDYDRVIVMDDLECPIDEYTVLWVDKIPEFDDQEQPVKWDYIVKRVAKPLDSVSYAIKKVDVS